MSIIGEAVLSASFEMLLKKLASPELLQFARQEKIHVDIENWKKKLLMIHAVLNDAEEKQMMQESVKIWLGELKKLAYVVEDILDEFATEALRRKLLHEPQSSTSKVRKLIPVCCTSLTPLSVKFNNMMGSKIKDITTRLQNSATDRDSLDLRENWKGRPKRVSERLPSTSLVNEAKVYGRERDKEAIVELLLSDDSSIDDGVSVIPIIGMGGVGKTTLAQLVYNDDRVKAHFDLQAWTCVSEDFDVIRVTRTIVKAVVATHEIGDVNDLNLLQVKLKEELVRKKFLLVLDDIWNENYEKWTVLCCPFESASPGSKILVTTRNKGVSSMMNMVTEYPLGKLSKDDCLRVFAQHSLGTKDFSAKDQDLKEIGEKIVNKCNGLPLAAKTLGGLLRGKYDINVWKYVLHSKVCDLSEEKCDIIPALRVSYYYLPPHLKRCFAYCSLFPRDYEFQEKKIILLWMAEGFLQHENNVKKMEELGYEYFCELKSRSFFQESSLNTSLFVMHDLIHDLAQSVAGEIYFRIDDMRDDNNQCCFSNNLRHLSYIGGPPDDMKKFEASDNINHLRTFLSLMVKYEDISSFTEVFCNLLPKLQRLRVLSFYRYCIHMLPNKIGDLKHLRYLDLSYTHIKSLPESVSTLYNLQTLLLEGCACLKKLCADMGNLISLHHLNNSEANSLEQMPLRIGKLTSLQTLPKFVVGKGVGAALSELKSLHDLRERLHISGLENVHDANDAKEADLNSKEHLHVLFLEWNCSVDNLNQANTQTLVLDMLRPHQKLTELIIRGYGGTKFPTWLGDSSFIKLVCLRFQNCGKCISFPSVWQLPFLKDLVIEGMVGVKSVDPEFHGNGCSSPFPSLETLYFKDMIEWEDWILHGPGQAVEGFPRLRELCILRCSKLQGELPTCLPKLEKLVIEECEKLSVSIPSSPMLCQLEIYGCNEVEWNTVDPSSLKSMKVNNVSNCVSLAERFMQGLPSLEELRILWCSKLQGKLPKHLPSLVTLVIENCEQLSVSIPCSANLCELKINGCKEVEWSTVDLSSLKSVNLKNVSNRVSLAEGFMQGLPKLEKLKISGCKEITSFCESGVGLQQGIEQQQQGLPCRLQSLELMNCECNLVKLPQTLHNLSSLQQICIRDFPSLVSFPEVGMPSQLISITTENCKALKSFPEALMSSSQTSLEILSISQCDSLTYIAKVQLPPNLKRLDIRSCNSLQTLVDKGVVPIMHKDSINNSSSGNASLLQYLLIEDCQSLTSLWSKGELPATLEHIEVKRCSNLACLSSKGDLPMALKYLSIRKCPNLESIVERVNDNTSLKKIIIRECQSLKLLPDGLNKLSHLQEITLWDCPSVVQFPEGGLPSAKFTRFYIIECQNLKAMPNGVCNLTSLQELTIERCPGIVSFPEDGFPTRLTQLRISECEKLKALPNCMSNLASLQELKIKRCPSIASFPEDGFPTNLRSLNITDVNICQPLFEWGLHRLTSLRKLCINGGCDEVKSFPREGMTFPTSLTILQIENFPNLESLSSMVQNLTSLEILHFDGCPKLKYFPEKGLPPSVSELYIEECPLLEKRCERDGQYWPLIAHIKHHR